MSQFQKHFFNCGWLMISLFPIALLFGRATENIFLGLYSAWGCLALHKCGAELEKKWICLFVGVVASFGLSILAAHDPLLALRKWLHISSQMLTFLFVLIALNANDNNPKRMNQLFFWLGAGGIVGLVGLYLQWLFRSSNPSFAPVLDMTEDFLPLLTPFMLCFVSQLLAKPFLKWGISVLVLAAVGFYVFHSQGRTAFLGLFLALLAYGCLVWRWRLYKVLLILGGILLVSVAVYPEKFIRTGLYNHDSLPQKLNTFSSGRIEIWMNGLKSSPSSLLTGVGLGNLRHIDGVAQFYGNTEAKNFHNFILNYWYETGLLGLTALLVFICWPTYNVLRHWQNLSLDLRREAGILFAAEIAILNAGFLNPTNLSPQFTVYLPLVLAGLIGCTQKQEYAQSSDATATS